MIHESEAKRIRSEIINKHGIRAYRNVKMLLSLLIENPCQYLEKLTNKKPPAPEIAQKLVNKYKDVKTIATLLEYWKKFDRTSFRREGGYYGADR